MRKSVARADGAPSGERGGDWEEEREAAGRRRRRRRRRRGGAAAARGREEQQRGREEQLRREGGRSSCGEKRARRGGDMGRCGGEIWREARPARGRYGEMRRGDMARSAPGEGETAKRSASRSENSRCTSLKERTRGIAGEALSLATSASDTRDEKKRCALAYAGAFGLRKSSMRRPSDSTDGVRK